MAPEEVAPAARGGGARVLAKPGVAAPGPSAADSAHESRTQAAHLLSCPITLEIMRDPVMAPDGHTYEREAIEAWLTRHTTSPCTGLPMDPAVPLMPNYLIAQMSAMYK